MSQLAGRIVLVTGASRGIGRAILERCQEAGARVVGVGRSLEPQRSEGRLETRCDVTQPDQVHRLAEELERGFGPPDVIVNSAGSFLLKPLELTTGAEFSRELSSNLGSVFNLARTFLPQLRKRGEGGRFITIGSIADHVAFAGNSAYSAAKFGVRGLHQVLREEYRGSGIGFTLISPGPTDTAVWDPYPAGHNPGLPARADMLRPEDVAEAVVWVAGRPARVDIEWIRMEPARGS